MRNVCKSSAMKSSPAQGRSQVPLSKGGSRGMCLFKLYRSTFQQRIAKKDRNYDRNYGPKFQSLIQKQSLTVVPPLRDVMRHIRQNDSGIS